MPVLLAGSQQKWRNNITDHNDIVLNDIVLLVERLQAEDALRYEEVVDRLSDYPGWSRWLEMVVSGGDRFRIPGLASSLNAPLDESGLITPRIRAMLLEQLFPYALLLDRRLTPTERALRLENALNIGAVRFCEECLQNENEEIVTEAQIVLEAYQAEQSLLRGAARPQDTGQELLRPPASASTSPDALLRAAEETTVASPRVGWLRRLWNWFRGRA
jgi:hypothetical protein